MQECGAGPDKSKKIRASQAMRGGGRQAEANGAGGWKADYKEHVRGCLGRGCFPDPVLRIFTHDGPSFMGHGAAFRALAALFPSAALPMPEELLACASLRCRGTRAQEVSCVLSLAETSCRMSQSGFAKRPRRIWAAKAGRRPTFPMFRFLVFSFLVSRFLVVVVVVLAPRQGVGWPRGPRRPGHGAMRPPARADKPGRPGSARQVRQT